MKLLLMLSTQEVHVNCQRKLAKSLSGGRRGGGEGREGKGLDEMNDSASLHSGT